MKRFPPQLRSPNWAPAFAGDQVAFGASATRLAGLAGVAFGWSPEAFWRATPAELAALVAALRGEAVAPPDAATLQQLMEAFPDG